MNTRFAFLALALALGAALLAQPDPNQPAGQGGRGPGGRDAGRDAGGMNMFANMLGGGAETVVDITPNGVFVIRSGAIAKYSPDLRLVGGIELFGALPAQPQLPQQPTDADRQKLREWAQQVGERNAPFTVLAQENMLHLVIGLRYFRVNQQTMKVEADGNLAAPPAAGAAAQPQRAAPQQRTAPLLKVDKETLYVVSGRDFIAAKTADATVITRVTLPEQLFPAVNWAGMGFGNRQDRAPGADRPAGGAGGGDRGNRGGDRGGERGNRAGGGDRAQ